MANDRSVNISPLTLSKIKQKKFSVLDGLELQDLFFDSSRAIAGAQQHAVEPSGTAHRLYPGAATRLQTKNCLLPRRKTSCPDIDILMHCDGTIAPVF